LRRARLGAQNERAMAESEPLVPQAATPAPQEADLFGDYSPAVTVASAVILVLAISVIDRLTGYDLQIGILHLVPIAMVTWALGRNWGLGFSAAVVALWIAMFRGMHNYASSFYFYWDALVLLVTFVTVALLLAKLREALRSHEVSLSMLEKLDAPAYVVDLQRDVVVFGNREFRAGFDGRPAEELARQPAREARFKLGDGTPALLRILS
jgi:hypothetical protein